MASSNGDNSNHHESSPLLNDVDVNKSTSSNPAPASPENAHAPRSVGGAAGNDWTADGLPLGQGSVIGEPMGRNQWNSSLFSCLGVNDDFMSSDLEVCVLGSVAPCVLYGSNVERLGTAPGNFAHHCLTYSGLYLIGNSFFGWNCLAPWFSYPSRTAIRRKFNLEGPREALHISCGCCGSFLEDELQREQCDSACDLGTHIFCHACALCQEAREIRRRMPHLGYNTQPVFVMMPPAEQRMVVGNENITSPQEKL